MRAREEQATCQLYWLTEGPFMRYRTNMTTLRCSSWSEFVPHYPGLSSLAALENEGTVEFRAYQALAVIQVLAYRRGIVRSATGSGKTLIMAACAAAIDSPTLILVHGRALVNQTHTALADILGEEEVGIIMGTDFRPSTVTVASIDTLASIKKQKKGRSVRRDALELFLCTLDAVFMDETHRASSDSWMRVLKGLNVKYRVGFSGTPIKDTEDFAVADTKLVEQTGPVLIDVSGQMLQNWGYIAPALLLIREGDYSAKGTRVLNWQQAKKHLIVENTARTARIVEDIIKDISNSDTRLLVLTGNSVALADSIGEELQDARIKRWAVVSGRDDTTDVQNAFADLQSGKLRCVITTLLADEGIDIPNVNILYLVGGGKSYVKAIQRVGRGLRKKAENRGLLVVDYHVTGNKFMERHDRKRLDHFTNEGIFSEVRTEEI